MDQNKLVLLVEDDENHMILGRLLLERLGFQVQTCDNGTDAIQLFSASPNKYSFIMTDYTMVPMNGIELASQLIKLNPSVQVLLCTGRDDPELIQAAKQAGVSHIALKPSNRQEMEDLLVDAGLYHFMD